MKSTGKGVFVREMAVTISSVIAFVLVLYSPSSAAEWNVGVSGDSKGINGFNLSVGEYYHVPEREVVVVHDRGIDDEEIPVVFFLAQRAHVSPEAVVKLRTRGMSWMDITLHFGLTPEVYYVPVRQPGPHGHAYGYYRNHPRHTWNKIVLKDRDIVDQVNLRFISDHYGYDPDRVMKYRSEGRNFVVIDRDVRSEKHGRPAYIGPRESAHGGKPDKADRKEWKKEWKEERKEAKRQDKGHGHGNGRD